MNIAFLDLDTQYKTIQQEIDTCISQVIGKVDFVGGGFLKTFEERYAQYIGVNHCIGVGNGTDALEIAIQALSLPKHSDIILPVNTFFACAEAIVRAGHYPVFCDVDDQDYTIDILDAKSRITANTSAIMPVHLYGHVCNMSKVMSVAKEYNLKVIEDCSQAHGSEYKGQKLGSHGDIATFSFYPGKTLGAYGDGGAIVTNNEGLAKTCRELSNHGGTRKYEHLRIGRNSRLDDIQASILNVKLNYIDQWIAKRKAVIQFYKAYMYSPYLIKGCYVNDAHDISHHLAVIRVKHREECIKYLAQKGIPTLIHYPTIITKLPAFKSHAQNTEHFRAEEISTQIISLPLHEHLTHEQIEYIVNTINQFNP